MADIQSAVRTVLANHAGTAALVSTRVYPDILPQRVATYPAVVLSMVTEDSTIHQAGISGLGMATIQVDVYAKTRLSAAAVMEQIRLALSDYKGTSQSVVVRHMYPRTGFTTYEPPSDSSDLGLYRHSRDFAAAYVEATS